MEFFLVPSYFAFVFQKFLWLGLPFRGHVPLGPRSAKTATDSNHEPSEVTKGLQEAKGIEVYMAEVDNDLVRNY
jgi:hypothetical protein